MFSYYGSKSKIVDCYPKPKYGKIIEPFAGSARYSLKWFDRDIHLIDKWEVIIKIWHYLQQASPKDIMGLPEPRYKEDIRDLNISDEERALLSFLVARGVATQCYIVQKFSNIDIDKKRIANNLFKIRHWKIKQGDYRDAENQDATWFIDPPYQFGGHKYHCKKIDYTHLSKWSQERQGQVIVCENTKATWMPFKPVIQFAGAWDSATEGIWSNKRTNFDDEQQNLFATVALQNVK